MELLLIASITTFLFVPIVQIYNRLPETIIVRLEHSRIIWRLKKYLPVIFYGTSLLLVVGVFWQVVNIKWSVIDDHEIIYFLGQDKTLYLNEFSEILSRTEVGNFGSLQRYRPFYYSMRILETVMWGDNPTYWYLFRLGILCVAFLLILTLVSKKLDWLLTFILGAYTLTFPYWVALVGSLGPGETYAVLGLALFMWGAWKFLSDDLKKGEQMKSGVAILCGSIICVGSKENFLLLILPLCYMIWHAVREKKYFVLGFVSTSIFFY